MILYNTAKDLTVFSSGVEEQPIKAVPINIVDNNIFKFFILFILVLMHSFYFHLDLFGTGQPLMTFLSCLKTDATDFRCSRWL